MQISQSIIFKTSKFVPETEINSQEFRYVKITL